MRVTGILEVLKASVVPRIRQLLDSNNADAARRTTAARVGEATYNKEQAERKKGKKGIKQSKVNRSTEGSLEGG